MSDKPVIRVFISSPGDVDEERRRAALVLRRLKHDYARFFDISPVLWEYEPMLASGGSFQDVIMEPAATDIVVVILWSRLGTHLPARTDLRHYKGLDGRSPVTGTEWEFENALAAARDRMARAEPPSPHILVYKKSAESVARGSTASELQAAARQMAALETFWSRHFENPEGELLLAYKGFKSEDQFEHLFEANMRSLLDARVGGKETNSIVWPGDPYRGLEAFEFDHSRIFFGRNKAVHDVVSSLARRAESGKAFLLVAGASGCGKSSLVKAGVLPSLFEPGVIQNVGVWRRCIFRLSGEGSIIDRLADALYGDTALPELETIGVERGQLARELAAGDISSMKLALAEACRTAATNPNGHIKMGRLVIVIDQFEELFTDPNVSDDERKAVANLLGRLAASTSIWTIATMRSDFFGKLSTIDLLRDLSAADGLYHLAPPRPEEIDAIIALPAEASGLVFERDPVTGIGLEQELREAASSHPHALPLLEFTLDELYRRDIVDGKGRQFRIKTYREDLKGIEGAISARADILWSALSASDRAILNRILTALVTVDDDGLPIGKPAAQSFLAQTPADAKVLDKFVDARLLVVFGPSATPMVAVAHEALITHWPRFSALIGHDRRFIEDRDRLSAQADLWHRTPDKSRLLPSGLALEEGKSLLQRRNELEPVTANFIDASIAAEQAAHRRRLWIAGGVTGSAVVVACVFAWLAYLADRNANRAQHNFEAATAALSTLVEFVPEKVRPVAPLGVSRELLERADNAIQRLPGDEGNSPMMRRYKADIYLALGTLSFDLSKYNAARDYAAKVQQLFGSTLDMEARIRVAQSQDLMGKAWHEATEGDLMTKDDGRAAIAYRKALAEFEAALQAVAPGDERAPRWALLVAQVHEDYGELLLNQLSEPDVNKRVAAAKAQFAAALSIRKNSPFAADPSVQQAIAWTLNKMADAELAAGNKSQALLRYREAREILARLDWVSSMIWQHHLEMLDNNIGLQLKAQEDWRGASDAFADAVEKARGLVARIGDDPEEKSVLAWSYDNAGDAFARWARSERKPDHLKEAGDMFQKASELRDQLKGKKKQWANDFKFTNANITALEALKLEFDNKYEDAAARYVEAAEKMGQMEFINGRDEFDLHAVELREWAGFAYLSAKKPEEARKQWEVGLKIAGSNSSDQFRILNGRLTNHLNDLPK
ncbi:MAG TPA: hypothetical protein VFB13_16050 [Reyranella sp.]|nr:hypothetical protein [Reyranella sp.]